MAKINCEFDSKENSLKITLDGEEVGNAHAFDIWYDAYDSKYYAQICVNEKSGTDADVKKTTWFTVKAAELALERIKLVATDVKNGVTSFIDKVINRK